MAPATKGDLKLVQDDVNLVKADVRLLRGDLKTLEENLRREMEKNYKSLNKGIDDVLTVLININKKFTWKVDDHEERIKQLEDVVIT